MKNTCPHGHPTAFAHGTNGRKIELCLDLGCRIRRRIDEHGTRGAWYHRTTPRPVDYWTYNPPEVQHLYGDWGTGRR